MEIFLEDAIFTPNMEIYYSSLCCAHHSILFMYLGLRVGKKMHSVQADQLLHHAVEGWVDELVEEVEELKNHQVELVDKLVDKMVKEVIKGLRTEDPFHYVKHYLSIVDNIQADGATRDTSRKLDQFTQFRFISLTEEEGWNKIKEYVQYQDDFWDELSPSMNISSISEAMQPTLKGHLKRAYKKISFLKTPTRDFRLKDPYLICDYYGGSHEADESINKSKTPEREEPTFATTTRSGISTQDPPFLASPRLATENFIEREPEKEGHDGVEPSITQESSLRPSILYQPSKTSNLPFPSRLKKQKKDDEDERLFGIFKQIHINLPFLETMIRMPKGAKVLKDLLLHKEELEKAASSVKLSEECSAIIQRNFPQKEGDPGSFTLPCLIGSLAVKNALADLGASINLMPHSLFRRLGISKLKPTKMSVHLIDRFVKYPIRVCENLLVKVSKFIFLVDFVVLEMDGDELVLITLGRPFLATTRVLIDIHEGKLSLRAGGTTRVESPEDRLKPSSVEPPKLKLKEFPGHLEYAFLQENNQLPMVISSALSSDKKPDSSSFPTEGRNDCTKNEKDELIPQWIIIEWHVCIDYGKLNNATRKDYFPLLVIDQMLERLVGHEYYCFLDWYSRYFQIPIAPEDQEKTTFTYPYGTFTYKRMPFRLCNALATFQRCMTAIFHELIEDSMEVFMENFFVFGSSFDHCLKNLEKKLKKVSGSGIEVNKAKIKAISKLPYPTNVKAIQSFLGYAGFYRQFIKDFSQITRPMTQLLVKDAQLNFSEECIQEFDTLKRELTQAPIMIKPDWSLPLEIMCDASDYAVGAVLGQRIDKHFRAIHYIRDKKGAENLAANHLSRLEYPDLGKLTRAKIRDLFPEDRLLKISDKDNEPCITFGMSPSYLNNVLIGSYKDAWPEMKQHKFFNNVTADHPENITASPPPQGKSSRPGFTGHKSFMMHVIWSKSAMHVSGPETFP
uniref:Reverse transcriptase domain-containing protein n=1 Tax=Tanacetum cinerariifolium TaxID=118510 RepID=A0A6L2J2Y1_TANCI|nr:reverse transcriptase domain-containing protein [Tanacetum cinerariifolium]